MFRFGADTARERLWRLNFAVSNGTLLGALCACYYFEVFASRYIQQLEEKQEAMSKKAPGKEN